jgi:cephalosporin hydroxylase
MSESSDPQTLHQERVAGSAEFAANRSWWRAEMGSDGGLRQKAVDLQVAADVHHHTYLWEWLGVPVIRLPDDIVVLQELIWDYRPERIVETGIARGGSMILNASLQILAGLDPHVLGIDISIFPHTRADLEAHPLFGGIELLESDSTSAAARDRAGEFLGASERAMLVLDSNHTHDHVLAELEMLAPLLPIGSYVLVADTLVEEFPDGHYQNRPWDRGNNPMTAARQFVAENLEFELDTDWSRRALLTEFRDGVLRRVR